MHARRISFDRPTAHSMAVLRQSALDGTLSEVIAYALVLGIIGLIVVLGFVL